IATRPPRGKAGIPERLSKLGAKPEGALTSAEALDLDSATAALTAALQSYGVRILGTYETETGIYSEPLELLSALYNGETRPVLMPRPEQDLGQHIPYSRVSFGLDALEVRGPSQRGFASILGIKEYPDASRAGRRRRRTAQLRRSSPEPAGAQQLARDARKCHGGRRCGARGHRRGRGSRGRQPRACFLGPVSRQRTICRPPGVDLQLERGRL